MSTDYRAELQRLVQAYDDHGGRWPQHHEDALHNAVEAARATLAQTEPEGPGPVDYRRWHEAHSEDCNTWSEQPTAPLTLRTTVEALAWANHCLARWGRPAIEPVPVAERPWEREDGWLDPDGECWWCPPDGPPYWQMANPAMVYGGWLLPHHALPIPTTH